jgi:hypothetical protein
MIMMITPAMIMAMAGIITTATITIITVIHRKPARFPGGEWGGRHCLWRLPLRRQAWCR